MEEGGSLGGEWCGESFWLRTSLSPPASPSDVPSAPLLLAVEDVSDSSVTVSWEPPERLGKLGLQGYVLELRREGGELWAKLCIHPGAVGLEGSRDKPPDSAVGSVQGEIQKEGEEAVRSSHSHTASCSTNTPLKAGGCPNGLRRPPVLQLQEASE